MSGFNATIIRSLVFFLNYHLRATQQIVENMMVRKPCLLLETVSKKSINFEIVCPKTVSSFQILLLSHQNPQSQGQLGTYYETT